MVRKMLSLVLIAILFVFTNTASAQDNFVSTNTALTEDNNESKYDYQIESLTNRHLVLRLFERELEDEVNPYHYLRLDFLKSDHVFDYEGTVKYEELEDKLIDDVKDTFEDVGEDILKFWIKGSGISDWARNRTDQRLRFDIYRDTPQNIDDRDGNLTLDAGMLLESKEEPRENPLHAGFRFHGLNDGLGVYLKWHQELKYGDTPKHDISIFPLGEKISFQSSSLFGGPKIKATYNWGNEKLKIRANNIKLNDDTFITFGTNYEFDSDSWGIGVLLFGRF